MKIIHSQESILDMPKNNHEAFCVTTNGMLRNNGAGIMGKGIALETKKRFSCIEKQLGLHIRELGNTPFITYAMSDQTNTYGMYTNVITFPTKNDWRDKSDINLIKESARLVKEIVNHNGITTCYLPLVGCGCGGLKWDYVQSELEKILDDRFIVVLRDDMS